MKVLTKDGLSYFWTKIKAFLNTKLDTISDLDTIRSGALLGSTALLSFTETDPTVPAHVKSITLQNITNWNNKLDSFTETDPIFNASVAAEITSTDISNWNSKTDNVGTITGINMNGSSKGTSGVVDLGTVITSETQLSKGTTSGSGNAVTDITVSNHQITLTKGKTFLESFTETDPIFTASPAADITSSDIEYWNAKQNKIIPPEVGSLYRTDVSGSGSISIRGTKGLFPTVNYADTYTLITTMQSSTQSYGINVNFGGNAYTLSTTNGHIEDTRQLTVNAGATWSASVVGNVSANTAISVKILGSLDYITTVGMAAITNNYADLDGKPSIPTVYNGKLTILQNGTNVLTFTANQSSNVTANIVVPTKVSDLTNDSGFINSFTETDPVFSASSAASITSSDITNWNSKTSNVGTITGITMNGVSKGTSGVVDLGTVITEHQSLASYAKTANYDSTTHKIYLKNGNTVLSEIDASDFIKDGMVSTVTIGNGTGANASVNCLIISFNTDSGKDNIEIPISNIFNASNYYTKTEIDNAGYLTLETDPTVPSWAKLSSKPSYNYSEIANTPNLATVATSGSYNDLSNKPTIPAAQVNADWNASSGVAKILNKPTIPSSTSQLINDSGYLTSYTETDPTVPAWAKAANKPTYTASEVGALPSTTYIPTKTSDLTNDSGYLTSYTETDPTVPSWAKQSTKPSYSYSEISNTPTLATVATSGSYNDLGDKPTIPTVPTNVSAFTNDSGYLTSHQDISGKQDALTVGNGIAIDNSDTIRAIGIPFGIVDGTSTKTAFTATVPGINRLEDGVCVLLKNGVVTSASGFTININGLGAKPCYSNMAAATAETTLFNINYTILFIYDSTRVTGGCWIYYRGYYTSSSNSIGYLLRGNNAPLPVSDTARYYKIYFTSADGTKYVPASVNSTNNATSARAVNQRPIDPFGRIVYTSATTNYTAGTNLAASTAWTQYPFSLGYSFNRTGEALELTFPAPIYIKCAPQTDGSAIMDANVPYVQSLPSTNDGKIYIYLGLAYSATNIEMHDNHPVYYHDGTGIRLWAGSTSGGGSSAQSDWEQTDTTANDYIKNKPEVLSISYNANTTALVIGAVYYQISASGDYTDLFIDNNTYDSVNPPITIEGGSSINWRTSLSMNRYSFFVTMDNVDITSTVVTEEAESGPITEYRYIISIPNVSGSVVITSTLTGGGKL